MTTRASHSLSPAPWQGKLGLWLGKLNGSLAEGWRPLVAEAPHAVSHPSKVPLKALEPAPSHGVWVQISVLLLTSCVIWGK